MLPRILLILTLAFCFSCGGVHYIRKAPPTPIKEQVGERPSPDRVWVYGHWEHRKENYVWMPGEWILTRPGYRWVPAYWYQNTQGWRFHPGHWEKAH